MVSSQISFGEGKRSVRRVSRALRAAERCGLSIEKFFEKALAKEGASIEFDMIGAMERLRMGIVPKFVSKYAHCVLKGLYEKRAPSERKKMMLVA